MTVKVISFQGEKKISSHQYMTVEEAIEAIKENSSWDCRPCGGSLLEWYDPRNGFVWRIYEDVETVD